MRLVACKACHAQYDTTSLPDGEFPCRCGATVKNENLAGIDARILRCGACGAAVAEDAEACTYCRSPVLRDGRDLSLICPECYARNAEETRFCTACGVAFRPQEARSDGYALDCPACDGEMPPHQVGGIGVNECAGCRGLWVPRENFDLLVNRAIDAHRNRAALGYQPHDARLAGGNPIRQQVVYRACPECGATMARRNFRKRSGVVVDRCPAHGTWLDADELEQIAGFILSGGRRPTDAPPGLAASPPPAPGAPLPPGAPPAASVAAAKSPELTPRTREILAQRRRRAKQGKASTAAKSVLGFLDNLLTMEIS